MRPIRNFANIYLPRKYSFNFRNFRFEFYCYSPAEFFCCCFVSSTLKFFFRVLPFHCYFTWRASANISSCEFLVVGFYFFCLTFFSTTYKSPCFRQTFLFARPVRDSTRLDGRDLSPLTLAQLHWQKKKGKLLFQSHQCFGFRVFFFPSPVSVCCACLTFRRNTIKCQLSTFLLATRFFNSSTELRFRFFTQ